MSRINETKLANIYKLPGDDKNKTSQNSCR